MTIERMVKLAEIRRIIEDHNDPDECAISLTIQGLAVSRAEGRRLFHQLKERT